MKRAKSVDDVVGFIKTVMKLRSSMMFRIGKCNLTIGNYFGHKKQIDLNGVWLEAKDRGQGEATHALEMFTEACDILGISVILEAQPMVKTMDFKSLVRFYTRHGFVRSIKHSDDNHFMMVRKPLTHKKKATAMAKKLGLEELAKAIGGTLVIANNYNVDEVLADGINAMYASIQKSVGQKHGDLAGHHFTVSEDALRKIMLPYVKQEIEEAKHR